MAHVPEETAEELYENAPCGYITTRPDGMIVRVNTTFLQWTAYSREELLSGRRLQDLLTAPGRIFYETHLAPMLRMQGIIKEIAADLLLRDATVMPVLLHAVQQRDAAGQPVSIRMMLVDMTERRRYERDLLLARNRAEQLAVVVSASGDAIMLTKPDGTIQAWNHGAERLFGWTADEAIGRRARELLVPTDRMNEHMDILTRLQTGEEVRIETVRRNRYGAAIDVSITLTPLVDALGEIVAVSSIIRDISDRRRIEAERRRAEQLQMIGTLAGGVAHEVNNQMTAVLGFGEMVRRALGPGHPQLQDMQDVLAAGQRAARISQQLLAFGRRQYFTPRELDLRQVITDLAPVLSRLLGSDKALVIEANQATRLVPADRTQIEQILINLTANARDAMVTGGRLTITTADAVLDDADVRAHPADDVAPGKYVLLSVTDTGSGMHSATLRHIFEPFFTTREVGQGTGLGLSVVHGIVKQHGGQIWASSEPGSGTTMRAYFPSSDTAAEDASGAIRTRPIQTTIAAHSTVMVVEDEPVVRHLARRVLEDAGLTVLEVENGRHAWEILTGSAEPPGLVLTDIVMPGMNGRQLGEAISGRWPTMPILYMSAYSQPDIEARGMLPHNAPFLQKPFMPEELLGRVGELLRQHRRSR